MLTPDELKQKQRSLRDGFPENLGLRVHRAISWLFIAWAKKTISVKPHKRPEPIGLILLG